MLHCNYSTALNVFITGMFVSLQICQTLALNRVCDFLLLFRKAEFNAESSTCTSCIANLLCWCSFLLPVTLIEFYTVLY